MPGFQSQQYALGYQQLHATRSLCQLVLSGKVCCQVVALVGPSGGGKSSIVKLVERFYLPSAGQVCMDGRDIGVYDEKWLRRRVAIVSQEPVLYGRRSARLFLTPLCSPSFTP